MNSTAAIAIIRMNTATSTISFGSNGFRFIERSPDEEWSLNYVDEVPWAVKDRTDASIELLTSER
jgi:hypothetical protein